MSTTSNSGELLDTEDRINQYRKVLIRGEETCTQKGRESAKQMGIQKLESSFSLRIRGSQCLQGMVLP